MTDRPDTTPSGGASVVVAMLTYRRIEQLPEAVDALLSATAELDPSPALLVVDNDPAATAMELERRWDVDRLRFVHEPTPGIAVARNRALDELHAADVVVFIDDDERPASGWLASLLEVWHQTRAAAVAGPVVPIFAEEPDPWIVEGGFFAQRRLPTGTDVSVAATNNLLLDLAQIREVGVRFAPELGTVGGSDTLFTRQLHSSGRRLVWCDDAVVYDVVPPERLTRRWVLLRSLRSGNSASVVALALEDGVLGRTVQRFACTGRGAARIAGGIARWLYGFATGSIRHRSNGARTLARGLGMAGGAWGLIYAEYRRRLDGP